MASLEKDYILRDIIELLAFWKDAKVIELMIRLKLLLLNPHDSLGLSVRIKN